MIRGIHHVSLTTGQLRRMIAFYCEAFGFDLVKPPFAWAPGMAGLDRVTGMAGTSGRNAMLRNMNVYLELFEYLTPSGRPADPSRRPVDVGITHLCFDVTDIHGEYARLQGLGVQFTCPPQSLGTVIATYGRDPDGNIFELQEILDPDGLGSPFPIPHG